METQNLKLPSPIDILENTLSIGKTESNILFLLWYLNASNDELLIDRETNPGEQLIFLENRKYGYSVNDLKNLTKLKQATIQVALKKLVEKKYFTRKKYKRSYYYLPSDYSYKRFQNNIKLYLKAFTNMLDPFINNKSFKNTLKDIKRKLENKGWYFSGWQEVLGNQKFIIYNKIPNKNLRTQDLNELRKDNHGKNLLNLFSQSNVFESLLLKAENPVSSPAHVESQIFNKLWVLQNQYVTN